MNCGNCGWGNEYGAKICVHCKATLALTDYFRPQGFVEPETVKPKPREDLWEQDILTADYQRTKHRTVQEEQLTRGRERTRSSASQGRSAASNQRNSSTGRSNGASRGGTSSAAGNRTANGKRTSQGKNSGGKGEKTSTARSRAGRTEATPSTQKPRTKTQRTDATTAKKTPSQKQGKKIPRSKAYNHTTKSLSLAEKDLKKKKQKARKKKGKRILPWVIGLLLVVIAAGIFMGTMQSSTDEERFTHVAEEFVRAMIMDDEDALADYVHPKMYGTLYPLGYENVERCDTKIVEYEEPETDALAKELQEKHGITDPIAPLYRVRVGCTLYGEGTFACTMDVVVGQIGGSIYALKTESISD